MANLDPKQQRLLESVKETFEQVGSSLKKLEEDYLYADYRAKAPVREAIKVAEEAEVPFIRIAREAMGFSYPAKLKAWLQIPEPVVERFLSDDVTVSTPVEFDAVVDDVKTVTRDPRTGEFVVVYQGQTYFVPSFGETSDPWTPASDTVPQGVYDLIQKEFPAWVLLEDDEE